MTDLPSAREFYWPLLRAMASAGEPLARSEADILDLTQAQREVMSHRPEYIPEIDSHFFVED
jgi:hypothetical protein